MPTSTSDDAQFLVQRPQFVFEVEVKVGHVGPKAFALSSLLGCMEQRRKRDDVFPQVAVAFHALLPLLSQPPTSFPISSMAFAAKP